MVEVLVAVCLLGTAGIAVLGAMATAARGSSVSRSQASALVWLQASADYLVSQTSYGDCASGAEAGVNARYQSALRASDAPRSPAGWPQSALSVERVEFWDGQQRTFGSSCTSSQLQQITLSVTHTAGRARDRLTVVKSR